ncbi:DUF2306 domain-containing protein [Amycolatopsis circi]|uniref:DUF2306 domain-containing protein n=1 Tax=Amycolatopsis circi TaxID=871959 RepID=UPI0013BEA9AC|nr:DUF2306 domain-containing protein [Amycolatopsis circi]
MRGKLHRALRRSQHNSDRSLGTASALRTARSTQFSPTQPPHRHATLTAQIQSEQEFRDAFRRFPSQPSTDRLAAVAVSAVGVALFSAATYLTGDPSLSRIPLNRAIALHHLTIVLHALPASLVLLIGPFQFATALRARQPKLHRVLGRIYVVSMIFAAVAAVVAATFSVDGISTQIAFYLLSRAWLYTLYRGYTFIRQGQIQLHRISMIRNYALSFAAVVLRGFLGIGAAMQGIFPTLTFADLYATSAWGSITVCVVVAEYFVLNRTVAPLVRKRQPAERPEVHS